MALKVQINGIKKDITRRGYAPVTFINGTKKRILKGITFINGEKKVLWDLTVLKIDYITGYRQYYSTQQTPVMVNDKYMITSWGNNSVVKYNIENLSGILLDSKVDWGQVYDSSSFDSSDTNCVFYSRRSLGNTTHEVRALTINAKTMDMGITQTLNMPSITFGVYGYISNGQWIAANSSRDTSGTSTKVWNNSTLIAQWGMSSSIQATKTANDQGIFTYNRDSENAYGLALVSPAGLVGQVVSLSTRVDDVMRDSAGNIIVTAQNIFRTYSPSYTVLGNDTIADTQVLRLIGQIRDYYYVLEHANQSSQDGAIYLRIYRLNGTLFERHQLNITRSSSGTGWSFAVVPSVSQTGYLLAMIRPGTGDYPEIAVRIQGY